MKKEELKKDVIRGRIASFVNYIIENNTQFIGIVFALCIAIGAYGVYKGKENHQVEESMQEVVINLSQVNSDPLSAESRFRTILNDYEEHPSGTFAFTYLSSIYYQDGDFEALSDLFDNYSVSIGDPLISASIKENRANILMNNGDRDASSMLDESLMSEGGDFLKPRLTISKALSYISEENYDQASKLLASLKNSDEISSVEKNKIEELIAYCNTKN